MYFYKIPQKVEPVIKLLDINAKKKKRKPDIRKETYKQRSLHHNLWYDSQEVELMEVSRERWMCQDVVRIYIMNYDSDKKKKNNEWKTAFCNNMDGPRVDHTRWRMSGIEQK